MDNSINSGSGRYRYQQTSEAVQTRPEKKPLGFFLFLVTLYYLTNAALTAVGLAMPVLMPVISGLTGLGGNYNWSYDWQGAAYRYGIPLEAGQAVVCLVAVLIPFAIGYGLFSQSKWGFWLAAIFHGFLLLLNLVRTLQDPVQPQWLGVVLPALVLASLWTNEDRFFPEDTPLPRDER